MSFNGSGTFQINSAGQPVVSGTVISSTAFNALTADLATGLSTCITKDGQTTVTANIPMGNNKITGLAVGTAATDAANLSQVQSTAAKLINSVSGADTVTGVLSPTLGAYAAGQMFYWVAAGDNTGAVTLNIDSLGAKSVTRDGSVALAAGDIKSGEVVVVVYDGTRFQVVSQLNSSGDARFANVSIASTLYVGGVATFTSGTAAAPAITTAGDTNTGIFFPAADTIAFAEGGVESARFDSSGRLGIGVTSPSYQLHVRTDATGTDTWIGSQNATATTTTGAGFIAIAGSSTYYSTFKQRANGDAELFQGNGTGSLLFGVNNTERMRLDSSGNLGLGVTPSAWFANSRVIQMGSGGCVAGRSTDATISELSANQFINASGNRIYISTNVASLYEQNAGQHRFFTAPSGTAGNAISFTQAMTLTAAGDLALGATATSGNGERLYVTNAQNNVAIFKGTGGGLAQILAWNDANKGVSIGAYASTYSGGSNFSVGANGAYVAAGNGAPFAVGTTDVQPLLLGINNTERARITSGGEFRINTTTSSYSTAAAIMDVNGGSTAAAVLTTSGGATYANLYCHNTATSGDNTFIDFGTEGTWTSRGSITYNRGGGVVAYNTTSDYRSKDVYGPIQNPGETIDALKIYRGKMKEATIERPMMIAHEAQEVVPYAVSGEKDAVNEDGTPKYQTMDHQILVPLLIAELQSLRKRVAELEAK